MKIKRLLFFSLLALFIACPPPSAHAEDCADLSILLSGPETAAPEEAIGADVSATAQNGGDTAAGQFAVGFYLSTDDIITTDDILLVGGREFEDGVGAGANLSVTIFSGMQIPSGITPGGYYLGAIVDELDAITDECDETNNTAAVPITIVDDCPDLTIELSGTASAAPEEAIGGSLTAMVRNGGDTAAGDFFVGFYLSTDEEITTDDILLIGGREHEDGLAANASLSVGIFSGMEIPSGVPAGNWFLGAIVDEQSGVSECNETNNTHAVPITITGDCPDLTISLEGPSSAAPEQEIGSLMSAAAKNIGAADVGQFALGFYLSTDSEITTDDILLVGGREHEDGLAAGGSLSVTIFTGMQIPSGIPPGDYYLGVIVDEQNAVTDECDETNNTHAIPITIAALCPDLTVTLTGPASAAPEAEIGNLMAATAKNIGHLAAGPFALGFYLSTDDTITTDDMLLVGGREHEDGLGADSDLSVTIFTGMQIPSGVAPGDYYLGVIVDEQNAVTDECDESNNTHAIPITIVENCPDLTVTLTAPVHAAVGEAVGTALTATAENKGSKEAGQFAVGFYLSTDDLITTDDVLLVGGREHEDGLAAGGSLSIGIFSGMQIPEGTIPGDYFIGVIVDEQDALDECDEANNTHAVPIIITGECPDLSVAITGPGAAVPGATIGDLVTAVAKNTGNGDAGQFALGFYLSTDETITTDDRLLLGGREFEDGLDMGQSLTVEIASSMEIPEGTVPGDYFLGVIVDELSALDECDETNNTHAVPITINGECPDLVVSLTGPSAAAPEQEIGSLVSARVENTGGMAVGQFAVGFYLSTDDIITTDDILLVGGREFEDALDAGAELSVDIFSGMQIPSGITPGSYFLGVIVDETSAIDECDETNNAHAVPITIGDACPDLSVLLTGPASAEPEQEIGTLLSAEVKNTGSSDAGQFALGFYLSEDDTVTTDDMLLVGGREFEEGLSAGGSLSAGIASSMQIPSGIAPGSYFLGVIVDELAALEECDETNNTHVIPITIGGDCPDLTVQLAAPSSAEAGDALKDLLSVTVENIGSLTTGEFSVGIYLSGDDEITTDDTLLIGGREFMPFISGESTSPLTLNGTMTIPNTIEDGEYFIGVIVDESNAVEECSETNNTHALPIRIGETECIEADLTPEVTDFSLTRSGVTVTLSVNGTVLNRGMGDAGDFSAGIYLLDKTIPGSAPILFPGSGQSLAGLAGGATLPLSLSSSFDAPLGFSLPRDRYDVGIWVDDQEAVNECDEDNNSAWVLLCRAPELTSDLALHLPELLVETLVGDISLWVNMNLVPFQGAFAFELENYAPNMESDDSGICDPLRLTPDGFIRIPRMVYDGPDGPTPLSADLLLAPVGDRVIFEIVHFEILP